MSRAGTGGGKSSVEPGARFLRMKVERAEPAAIDDFSGFIEDINALRPAGIEGVGGVGHGIHTERNREVESQGEIIGDGHALGERFWLRVTDAFIHI